MSRIALARRLLNSAARNSAKGAAAIAVVSLAGCSADIGRFDFPSSAYTTKSGTTGSIPTPLEPMPRRGAGLGSEDLAARPSPSTGPGPIATTPPTPRDTGTRVAGLHDASRPPVIAAPPPPPSRAPVAPSATGATIEVKPGDTLSGIAHRHGSSISELMSINGLTSPSIKPGQRLTLPPSRRGPRSRSAIVSRTAPSTAPAMLAPAPPPARGAPIATAPPAGAIAPEPTPAAPGLRAAAVADGAGTYTVRSGDSLYAIARRHRVTLNQLQQANGISDPTKIKPGDVLRIPGAPSGAAPIARIAPRFTPAPAPVPPPLVASPATPAPGTASLTAPSGTRLTVLNPDATLAPPPPPRVAALGDAVVPPIAVGLPAGEPHAPAAPPVAAISPAPIVPAPGTSAPGPAPIKFRWPAKGRVIGNFGARPDATHSDGIKISVPVGADVVAAEGGVVAYAGSELKGYGNLILIRHDNNWVTAYAHNDELLVKRGDKVRRGQSIAKAGKTGNVEQPQLHFELRQGAKPVDPVPYLEPL